MQGDIGPQGHAAHHGPPDAELVEQGDHLARVAVHAVLRGVVWLVARAVTEEIEEHDAKPMRGEAPRELPIDTGVEQQPTGENDHAVALAVYLVAERVSPMVKPAKRHPLCVACRSIP